MHQKFLNKSPFHHSAPRLDRARGERASITSIERVSRSPLRVKSVYANCPSPNLNTVVTNGDNVGSTLDLDSEENYDANETSTTDTMWKNEKKGNNYCHSFCIVVVHRSRRRTKTSFQRCSNVKDVQTTLYQRQNDVECLLGSLLLY